MVEYLQELRVRDGNQIRIINNHVFKEKCMTDEELEAKKIEFSKHMQKIDETSFEIIAEENVECCECENDGNYIQDIAEWGDENGI